MRVALSVSAWAALAVWAVGLGLTLGAAEPPAEGTGKMPAPQAGTGKVAVPQDAGKTPALLVAPFDAKAAAAAQESWAKHLGAAVEVKDSIGMKLVLVPAGEFMMGSGESADELAKAYKDYGARPAEFFKREYPQHRVRITRPFYLGAHEVTIGQFRQFVKDSGYKTDAKKGKGELGKEYSWQDPDFEQADDHPVLNVSWNDAVAFCEWLSRKEGKTYRLPTAAEWEYACRAGTTTRCQHGDDPEGLAAVGNVADATLKEKLKDCSWAIKARDGYVVTAPVGRFRPNGFGLFDMHGNVWEWCGDWYAADYYGKSPADDPKGPDSGDARVLRGGSWVFGPHNVRSAYRDGNPPGGRSNDRGFRVARTP